MNAVDPRQPVLIGVGQALQRPDDPTDAVEAVTLVEQAVRAALDDTGAAQLAARLDRVVVVRGAWSYRDPARILADRIGADRARTGLTTMGGETPVAVLGALAADIVAGHSGAAVLCGGETIWSRRQLRARGLEAEVSEQPDTVAPNEVFGGELEMSTDHDRRLGLDAPVRVYPMFETALRHHRNESVVDHARRLGELYARFNQIAMANPFAWIRTPMSAEVIARPTPDNRYIAYPYTKAMNSNWFTDQAAALVVCSAGLAAELGVPRDRWVFLAATTTAKDTARLGERLDLAGSRSLRVAGPRCLDLAGVGIDDVAHLDLYSCFPSAVQIAALELGVPLDRDLTVTGGMSFFGGPMNDYTTHALATMVPLLRADAGSTGLVVGNGGYLTKHAVTVLAHDPPAAGFRLEDCQAGVDWYPTHAFTEDHEGPVRVEAYTVDHVGGEPVRAVVSCLTDDEVRCWATSTDPLLMAAIMADDACGWSGHVHEDVLRLA